MKRPFILLALAVSLSACGSLRTVPYDCPLDGPPADDAHCVNVQDTYRAARASNDAQTSVFDRRSGNAGTTQASGEATPYVGAVPSAIPGAHSQGMPVFVQPKVFRAWVRPYKDVNGNIHGGEAVYFSTQGSWNYGQLSSPGSAGAHMPGPTRPGTSLGFNPMVAPAKQPAGSRAVTPPAPAEPADARPPVPGGITQPYQRLTQ